MDASTLLWEKWHEQVKDLLPAIHGHRKKTLALSVLGIVLSKSAILQRMRDPPLFARYQCGEDAQH